MFLLLLVFCLFVLQCWFASGLFPVLGGWLDMFRFVCPHCVELILNFGTKGAATLTTVSGTGFEAAVASFPSFKSTPGYL